jgi:hypothetical protein
MQPVPSARLASRKKITPVTANIAIGHRPDYFRSTKSFTLKLINQSWIVHQLTTIVNRLAGREAGAPEK